MSEIRRAVEAIKSWFTQHAPAIVANLNPGATEPELAALRAEGFTLGEELRELYLLHDGQRDHEGDFLLPNVGFLPLARATEATDRALQDLFGCPAGHETPPDQMVGHSFWNAGDEELFLEEEWTADWFCFGESWDELLVQNARTGRVFAWPRKDGCVLMGSSLAEMLEHFAGALHAGQCQLSGDPSLPGVAHGGFVHRRRYVSWYPRSR